MCDPIHEINTSRYIDSEISATVSITFDEYTPTHTHTYTRTLRLIESLQLLSFSLPLLCCVKKWNEVSAPSRYTSFSRFPSSQFPINFLSASTFPLSSLTLLLALFFSYSFLFFFSFSWSSNFLACSLRRQKFRRSRHNVVAWTWFSSSFFFSFFWLRRLYLALFYSSSSKFDGYLTRKIIWSMFQCSSPPQSICVNLLMQKLFFLSI